MVEFKTRDELKEHISTTYGIDMKVIEIGKLFQNRITVFGGLAGKEVLISYDYIDWSNKDKGLKLAGLYSIPTFMDLDIYPDRFVPGVQYPCKEIPIEDLLVFGEQETDEENSMTARMETLSAKDFACIMLQIPDTNKKWLNSLIKIKNKQ
jgi:hypothetical protein